MHIWNLEAEGRWARVPIERGLRIGPGGDGRIVVGERVASPLATIIAFEEHAKKRAALVFTSGAGISLTVNGYPPLGVTLLEDHDEIVIRAEAPGDYARFLFAELDPVRVVRFSESAGATDEGRCVRCRQPLRSGDAAVRCPVCARWYHEGPLALGGERGCFSYDPACGGCQTSRAAMSWSPASGDDGEDGDDGNDSNDWTSGADGTDREAAAMQARQAGEAAA